MKTFHVTSGVLLLPVVFLLSCADEEPTSPDSEITFIISSNNKSLIVPAKASALITVENKAGETVLDHYELKIRNDGDHLSCEPVNLPKGNYTLTHFVIIDDSGDPLYATPLKNTSLGATVDRPLPYTVPSESDSEIMLPLLDVRVHSLESMGYKTYGSNLIKLQAYIPNRGNNKLTTAEAYIMQGNDTVEVYPLGAKLNLIPFNGQPGETYSLVVIKDSYSRFSYDLQTGNLPKTPIKAVLDPALTVVGIPITDQNYFSMQLDGVPVADFNIDWGDGTTTTWTSGITTLLDHYYDEPGKYFISITSPSLETIVMVGDLQGGSDIERIGMQHLSRLFEFRMEWHPGPKVLDFTHCGILSEIRIGPGNLEDIIIPNDANIYLLELVGNINVKQESFDELINDLHHQITNNPRSGDLLFNRLESVDLPIVDPSPETIEKLLELKNTYHWYMVPNPELL